MEAISPSMSGFLTGSLNRMTSCARTGAAERARMSAVASVFLIANILSMSSLTLQANHSPDGVLDAGRGADPSIFLQQDVQESVEPLELLQDPPGLEERLEGLPDGGPREEVVVVIPVDQPVPRALLAGMVAELHGEDGQQQVPAGLQHPGDAATVPRPVARDHVVEAAVVEDQVERGVVEAQVQRVAGDIRRLQPRLLQVRAGFLQRQRLEVEGGDVIALPRQRDRVAALAAAQVEGGLAPAGAQPVDPADDV